MEKYSFYKSFVLGKTKLYISKPFEGEVHLAFGNHGGELYSYVDFIECDDESVGENIIEEMELYVEKNLDDILKNCEKI